jgi:hypothetical protein
MEVLQLASQHQGDQAIDSLAGLASSPHSGATGHESPLGSSQGSSQASCEAPANAHASANIKAATAPGVVSSHPLMLLS